jgi:hypothetical protein
MVVLPCVDSGRHFGTTTASVVFLDGAGSTPCIMQPNSGGAGAVKWALWLLYAMP